MDIRNVIIGLMVLFVFVLFFTAALAFPVRGQRVTPAARVVPAGPVEMPIH